MTDLIIATGALLPSTARLGNRDVAPACSNVAVNYFEDLSTWTDDRMLSSPLDMHNGPQ